ncbi:MAG: hypothetical protein JNM07_04290 [Phycisphaerae bacterium]|nr:hypothetical protein [Phycisphaerae bacterium]
MSDIVVKRIPSGMYLASLRDDPLISDVGRTEHEARQNLRLIEQFLAQRDGRGSARGFALTRIFPFLKRKPAPVHAR